MYVGLTASIVAGAIWAGSPPSTSASSRAYEHAAGRLLAPAAAGRHGHEDPLAEDPGSAPQGPWRPGQAIPDSMMPTEGASIIPVVGAPASASSASPSGAPTLRADR